MAAKFEATRNYEVDKIQLIENAKIALDKCKFKLKFIDEKSGKIIAKSKFSFWSFSEDIDIQIEDNGGVTMKSECALPTQIIDWGKNKRNIEKFFGFLDQLNRR